MINIRHVGIVVSDIDKSLYFYKDLLGFEIKKNNTESGEYIDTFLGLNDVIVQTVKISLSTGDMIELLHYKTNKEEAKAIKINQIGCTHIAVTVDNLDETYKRLKEEGVSFINPPFVSSSGFAKVAFCKDPDGFFIEMVEELK